MDLKKFLKKLRKNKLLLGLIVSLGVIGFIVIVLLIVSPAIQVESLSAPQVETTPGLTGLNYLTFNSSSKAIYVNTEFGNFAANANSVTINNIPEGKNGFSLRSMQNFFLFKLVSKESTYREIEFDYTAPQIKDLSGIDNEYYQLKNLFSFKSEEPELTINQIIDGKTRAFIHKKESTKSNLCSVEMTEGVNEFVCELNLPAKKSYPVKIWIEDAVGNTLDIQDETVNYIEPVSLTCPDLPVATNQEKIKVNCKANKDGFVLKNSKKVKVSKQKAVTLEFKLKEGTNILDYTTYDESGREFNLNKSVIKDSKAPIIKIVSMPDSEVWGCCGYGPFYVTIEFSSSEDVTGSYSIRGYYSYGEDNDYPNKLPGYRYIGSDYASLNLKKNESFSRTYDTGRFQLCYGYGGCGNPSELLVIISLKDKAGNSTTKAYYISLIPPVGDGDGPPPGI